MSRRALKPIDLSREREIQADCKQLYESVGCVVVSFSQHRLGSGTHQTPGIADLRIYCPRKLSSWWHEVKTPSGEQSADQKEFQRLVQSCGEHYRIGGMEAAVEQLRAIGLLAVPGRS